MKMLKLDTLFPANFSHDSNRKFQFGCGGKQLLTNKKLVNVQHRKSFDKNYNIFSEFRASRKQLPIENNSESRYARNLDLDGAQSFPEPGRKKYATR